MNTIRTVVVPKWQPLMNATRYCCKVQITNLLEFPVVKIGEGKLKYILAKVYVHGEMKDAKTVVRGVASRQYHLDIYESLQKEAHAKDLCTQCLGGGILLHDPKENYIKLYGRSQTIGKANHHDARDVLRGQYLNYKIDAESGPMAE